MLNSVEHDILYVNKYKDANYSLGRKNLQFLLICDLLAERISCSAELSILKKSIITSGPGRSPFVDHIAQIRSLSSVVLVGT